MALPGIVAAAERGDVVLLWNDIALQTVIKAGPPIQARNVAISQLAVLNAMTDAASLSASAREIAAIVAAHDTLAALHPDHTAALDDKLSKGLANLDANQQNAAVPIGKAAAAKVLARRQDDGYNAKVGFESIRGPGLWEPTPPGLLAPIGMQLGKARPFALQSTDQFRPEPPAAYSSPRYLTELHEVLAVGGALSSARPAEKTDAANFWIGSAVQEWNPAAQQVATAARHPPLENARTLALLNVAMADALAACFEAKYTYKRWRPVTAIRAGVGDIRPEPEWLPFIVTPPFPAFPSAHACAAGAAQEVLERRFGPNSHQITLTSATAPDVTFHYTSFNAISDQIDDARVYGGIHTREDQAAGRALGRKVAGQVFELLLGSKQ
jgi:hypothetical protein